MTPIIIKRNLRRLGSLGRLRGDLLIGEDGCLVERAQLCGLEDVLGGEAVDLPDGVVD